MIPRGTPVFQQKTRMWLPAPAWAMLPAPAWAMLPALAWAMLPAGCAGPPAPSLGEVPAHRANLTPTTMPAPASPSVPATPATSPAAGAREDQWRAAGCRPWRYVIIHHSSSDQGNAGVFDKMHRGKGWDELGYHFVIDNGQGGPDGNIEVGTRWRCQKWGSHTGGTPNNEYNNHGIGICLVGDFMTRMPTHAQLAAMQDLVTYLMRTYGIPPENVIGHRDAPNATTSCPGDALHGYVHGAAFTRKLPANTSR